MRNNQNQLIENIIQELGRNNYKVSENIRDTFYELVSINDRLFSEEKLSEKVDIKNEYNHYITSYFNYGD